MTHEFTDQSQKILAFAQAEARQLNHDYVGTEHILLAILIERPGALEALGVTADAIRQQIGELVTPGLTQPAPGALPLTPRARSVIGSARLEMINHGQKLIEPEHLLLGLIHEPDGVASRVMRKLGLDLRQVRENSLKLRLAQMKIVERAVRPVRAGMARKRKMREEFLAHLSEIFEEELSRLNDPDAALNEAAKRFGDSAQLSRELQGSLTSDDRRTYWFERWFGWRPPESAVHMMLRASFLFFCANVCLIGIPMLIEMSFVGWDWRTPVALRTIGAMLIFVPLAQFLIGVCYYKIRDSLFGVFGARKSLRNGMLIAGLASLSVLICGVCTIGLMNDTFGVVRELAPQLIGIAILAGITSLIVARFHGPKEIRDTIWSCMDLETAE